MKNRKLTPNIFINDRDTGMIMNEGEPGTGRDETIGVLVKSVEIIPVVDHEATIKVKNFNERHVISFYLRTTKQYVLREIDSTDSRLYIITILGKPNPSSLAIHLIHYLNRINSKLIWSSGVCLLPDDFLERYKESYDLDQDVCSWEGIVTVEDGTIDAGMIEAFLRSIDVNDCELKATIVNPVVT